MPAHVLTIPPNDPTPATPRGPGWAALSVALTDEVPLIADRDDLIVRIAPGAGRGAPACFLPASAVIEVDGSHLRPVDPTTVTPHLVADRARYAATWGLLVHECAHARHSGWDTPPGTPAAVRAAAELLEESRIEHAQIRRRPDDRHWLRCSATHLLIADCPALDPSRAATLTDRDAAQTAGLLLARADAGILTQLETSAVRAAVLAILGQATLDALRAIWADAHTVGDEDADVMLELGRRWCDVLGIDPDAPSGHAEPGSGAPPDTTGAHPGAGQLAQAAQTARARLTDATTTENTTLASAGVAPGGPSGTPQPASPAQRVAAQVFDDHAPTSSTGRNAVTGTRPPTGAERRAARRIGEALTTAGARERAVTRTTSALPPGRLRMRGALAADAQRAAGAVATAEPFTRVTRVAVPTPPLRVGIACDVSGSMARFTGPVASTAWILASTARHARVSVTAATVIFGETVHPIGRPGVVPERVTVFGAPEGRHAVDEAVDALDGALDLTGPGAARLLVIVSDGIFEDDRAAAGQARVTALRAAGCGVLWLAPAVPGVTPFDGATVLTLTDRTATATAIAQAAKDALRRART